MSVKPSRGDVWIIDLEPVIGREQGRRRPALVLSTDTFNQGPAELVIVVPLTTTQRGIPLHVRIDPPEGGLKDVSYIKTEDIRSVSTQRLAQRLGNVSQQTLDETIDRLRILLDIV